MRLLISAEESAGVQAVRSARQSGHEVVAVLTTLDNAGSDRQGVTVESVATRFGYPVRPATLLKEAEFADTLKQESIDILLNVHSLHVADENVVAAPRVGAFNLHPGPLPRYAGMNAPARAILNGEFTHGVTLHWMEAGIDTGDIAFQEMFDLSPNATVLDISRSCVRLGIGLIKQLLATDPDQIPRTEQDLTRRTYYGFECPFDGEIPWHSAEMVERFIRACNYHPLPSPWGIPAVGNLGILEVKRTGEPCEAPAGTLSERGEKTFLATGDEWLELKRTVAR